MIAPDPRKLGLSLPTDRARRAQTGPSEQSYTRAVRQSHCAGPCFIPSEYYRRGKGVSSRAKGGCFLLARRSPRCVQAVGFAPQRRALKARCLSESYVLRQKAGKARAGAIPARAGGQTRAILSVRGRRPFPARAFDRAHRATRPSLGRQTPHQAPILHPQAGCAARRPIV
jgi:hypothetical protein